MKPYIIENSTIKPYSAIVIGISSESPYSFWQELDQDLKGNNIKGKILVDCLLHIGNYKNRFLEVDFNSSLDTSTVQHIVLKRENYFRKYSTDILSKFPYIIKNSILNKYQKELLLRKVVL